MADFVVTIRSKNGSLEERAYTANDRAELFKKLAADGVSAVRVNEGAVGKKPRKAASGGAPAKGRGLIAATAAVLIAGVAVWLMWPEAEKPVEAKKEVKKNGEKASKILGIDVKESVIKKDIKITLSQKINNNTNELARQTKTIYELRPDINWDSMTNRTFSTGVEQLLSWICRAVPGEMMLPLPPLVEEEKRDIAAILISRNDIKDTDSEDVAMVKEDVSFAKKELAKFIKEGGNPDEFFEYYNNVLKQSFEKRKSFIEELQAMQSDDESPATPEEIKIMVDRINKSLSEEGIKPVIFDQENNSIF
jgi:hypothetical protein